MIPTTILFALAALGSVFAGAVGLWLLRRPRETALREELEQGRALIVDKREVIARLETVIDQLAEGRKAMWH